MSLSDKMWDDSGKGDWMVNVSDVREFIVRLNKRIEIIQDDTVLTVKGVKKLIQYEIQDLAGEKLIVPQDKHHDTRGFIKSTDTKPAPEGADSPHSKIPKIAYGFNLPLPKEGTSKDVCEHKWMGSSTAGIVTCLFCNQSKDLREDTSKDFCENCGKAEYNHINKKGIRSGRTGIYCSNNNGLKFKPKVEDGEGD